MKKHRYKAINVKQVSWEKLCSSAAGQRIVFSVDVAKEEFFGVLMKSDLTVIDTLKWIHPVQTRELVGHLLNDLGASAVEVVMEPSGTYGDALRAYFTALGVRVYRVSPKRVHDAAEVYDGVPSLHDAKAAYLIGRLHLDGASREWMELTAQRRDHQALIAELELYQSEHRRNLNRLEASLSRHWPEVGHIMALNRVSLLSLVAEYGDPRAVSSHCEEAGQLLRRTSRGALKGAQIQRILESAQQSLGIVCTEGERHWLKVLGQALLRTHRELQAIERCIQAEVKADVVLTHLAKVVGATTSMALEASQGSPLDYPNAGSYVKGMGLNLKERSSGKHKGQLKITKRGPGRPRKYLHLATLRMSRQDPVMEAWYQNKIKRDGNRKGKATVALMRKLAMALWHVARGEDFDSRKLFNVRTLGLAD